MTKCLGKRSNVLAIALGAAGFFLASPHARATLLTVVTPDSLANPPVISPYFGQLAANGLVTTQYSSFGLDFGPGRVGVFADPPDAFGGVNGSGVLDLVASVPGYFVAPNSTTPAVTDYLQVEAGLSAPSTLELQAFDANNNLLATVFNTPSGGIGPHGRSLLTISAPGIHSFLVSSPGTDTFGVDQIAFDGPQGLAGISGGPDPATGAPEPTSLTLLGMGLVGGMGYAGLRRRKKAVTAV